MGFVINSLSLVFLLSCAGYKLSNYHNPLEGKGVKALYVKMFYNESLFPEASSILTRETFDTLAQFRGLKVISDEKKADGVLIGVVKSSQSQREAIKSSGKILAGQVAPLKTKNRKDFNITGTNLLSFKVHYKLLGKEGLIWEKTFSVAGGMRREIYGGDDGVVNETQTSKAIINKLKELSKDIGDQLKNAWLYEDF